MTAETIHTCSYSCERPECIRAQRDELAARLTAETSNARGEWVLVPRELLDEARNIAMAWTLKGRVPECRKFGQIAQDLDAMLAAAPPLNEPFGNSEQLAEPVSTAYTLPELREAILDCLNLAHAEGTARKASETAAMADRLAAMATALTSAPPSAPVGVEAIAAEIRASLVRGATVCTRRRWAIELEALAQQLAAVDASDARDAERYRWLRRALLGAEDEPIDHLLLEKEPETEAEFDAAVDAALAAQHQEPTT